MSDDELIVLAKQGDRRALNDLIERYLAVVERFAYQIGVSANDVEDVTQDVFIRVYRFLEQYTGKTFSTWLYKITLNAARDHFKKQKRDQHKQMKLFRQPREDSVITDDDLLRNEEAVYLHQLIQRLDEKYRFPIILFYFHDKKLEEIADIMDLPLSTVKTRLARGRSRLKKQLEEKGGDGIAAR